MAREHYETLQQVFDDAYRGLAAQGFERSIRRDANGAYLGCAYRGSEGRRCALGHCIPDDRYNALVEEYVGIFLVPRMPGLFSSDISDRALSELQGRHDAAVTPGLMRTELAAFAASHDLTIPDISSAA